MLTFFIDIFYYEQNSVVGNGSQLRNVLMLIMIKAKKTHISQQYAKALKINDSEEAEQKRQKTNAAKVDLWRYNAFDDCRLFM